MSTTSSYMERPGQGQRPVLPTRSRKRRISGWKMIGIAISSAGNEFLSSQSSTVRFSTDARIAAPTITIVIPRSSDIAVVPFSSSSAR